MNAFLVFLFKSSLYTAVFYMAYALFLSRDTMYRRNRSYILVSVAASLILPFVTIDMGSSESFPVFGKRLSEIVVNASSGNPAGLASMTGSMKIMGIISGIYLAGAAIAAIKFIADILEILILISGRKISGSGTIRFRGLNTAGFSAFGHIFINSGLTPEEAEKIEKHETIHVDLFHFVDILFLESAGILLWFNPFIHLLNKSLRAVHEYQADEGCISCGIPVTEYQKLIINQIFGSGVSTITNSFSNPTLIKKRMIMMTKKRSRISANLKIFLVLPLIAAVMLVISSCQENGDADGIDSTGIQSGVMEQNKVTLPGTDVPPPPPPPADEPFMVVEEMPLFPGGDVGLLQFIAENTSYPEEAKTKGIQGRVIVRFCVETDGSVNRLSVMKGIDPLLDSEALRVVGSMPKFEKAGHQGGKAVPVWYMVPITFKLE
ncbi:MAG: M56 family metallopeptidase [Bacteroidales bacterium]|jgi:TonB family protein|nr:M56 family metallopeptidase [Bacteroidales bacterium]